ncbi:hypothetical protein T05_5484 [Trichinella murrelli]|uniref:Uncharacterized protein n=1 Tax=Trichinella murrelli TaxID=144512 RepID=A0A0V0UAE0_9BILA|nr:hypothetical protein T05_5484 [Trichinella murrelli]
MFAIGELNIFCICILKNDNMIIIGLNLKVARDILKVAIEAFLWDEEFLLIIEMELKYRDEF